MAAMALSTPFTRAFSLRHPIALAPMGGSAGGALTAAVSNGGGLGLLGGGPGDPRWLARELARGADAQRAYRDGVARGDLPPLPVWASEAIDLINDLPSAADLVGVLAAQAEDALARAGP
jgi:hypothetical protein